MSGRDPAATSSLAALLKRHRTTLRILFWCYAVALITATHWPALEIPSTFVERPDLLIHFTCFGGWFVAFWLSGYMGEPLKLRSILLSVVVACLYAGFDEGSQAIPFVRRHCAWDDFFANCGGISLASLAAIIVTLASKRPRR